MQGMPCNNICQVPLTDWFRLLGMTKGSCQGTVPVTGGNRPCDRLVKLLVDGVITLIFRNNLLHLRYCCHIIVLL